MIPDFKKKQKNHPSKNVLLVLGLASIALLLCGLILGNFKIYQKKKAFLSQVESLETKAEDLKKRNQELQEGIAKSGDADYIEKVAREELDLQKEGETVVSFVMSEDQREPVKQNEKNVLQAWFGWLAGTWNGAFNKK